MFLTPGLGFDCLVFATGVVWWRQLLKRAGEDMRTLRETQENSERAAIAILWGVSVLWGMWMVGLMIGMVRGLLFVAG